MNAAFTKWISGKASVFSWALALSFCTGLTQPAHGYEIVENALRERIAAEGELAPFPEAQPLLVEIAAVVDSNEVKTAIEASRTLQMMRERVRTTLFHLNFKFESKADGYPYDPPFREPFPFRPTLEAIEEANFFLSLVEKATGLSSNVQQKIADFPHFEELKALFPAPKVQGIVEPITKEMMEMNPVESYETFQNRLRNFGETASFPEFAEAVSGVLNDFASEEIARFRAKDAAFDAICERSIAELVSLQALNGGKGSRLYGRHTGPYPYRRTLQALERAVLAFDYRERLKYPDGVNWHDVELSWFMGDAPKLLPLYHYNRYKYQLAGLLADHEQVLMPNWGVATFEYLSRLRAAPIGVLEISTTTARVDRHHNSPIDNFYHDANHIRRMWGYDKRKQQKRGARTREEKMAIYREQDAFMKMLLSETDQKKYRKDQVYERNLMKQMRIIIFETLHETALTPDLESLLYDLLRAPATPQPFEVQVQQSIADLEMIRSFDGNLRSGADQLSLNLMAPTLVRYFYDRAPGFLANVDNKQRWGFFDSVFDMQIYMPAPGFRTPSMVAAAAEKLFSILGKSELAPDRATLVKQTIDHSGQPELWNYFSVKDADVVRVSSIPLLNVAAAEEVHSSWRLHSQYESRWKPTNAKLVDGTIVSDEWSLGRYLKERGVPEYLTEFYKLDADPATGETILFEDIRNLPHDLLANNHQGENLMSGAKAVSIVDRLWRKEAKLEAKNAERRARLKSGKKNAKDTQISELKLFRNLDDAERWLVGAAQGVHQAVLDRNANGARNNPIYNQHWLLLPTANQINDLELVRIGFEARLKKGPQERPNKGHDQKARPESITHKLRPETVTLFREALSRLYRKIKRNEPIRSCESRLSVERNEKLAKAPPR